MCFSAGLLRYPFTFSPIGRRGVIPAVFFCGGGSGAPAAAAAPTLVEAGKKKAPKSVAVTDGKPARGRKTG